MKNQRSDLDLDQKRQSKKNRQPQIFNLQELFLCHNINQRRIIQSNQKLKPYGIPFYFKGILCLKCRIQLKFSKSFLVLCQLFIMFQHFTAFAVFSLVFKRFIYFKTDLNSTTNLQVGQILPQVGLNTRRRGDNSRKMTDTVTIEENVGES